MFIWNILSFYRKYFKSKRKNLIPIGHNINITHKTLARRYTGAIMLHIRLKAARQALNLTQQEAASALSIGQSFLSKLERGDKRPNVELLSQMAKLYGVTESHLIGNTEPETDHLPMTQSIVIKDDSVAPGLRALAMDNALVDALEIGDDEWNALRSLTLPGSISKGGYVQLLATIRGVCQRDTYSKSVGRIVPRVRHTPITHDSVV